jgi:hypothetical protein
MGVLKDPRFWIGLVVGYLLCHLMPVAKVTGSVKGGPA